MNPFHLLSLAVKNRWILAAVYGLAIFGFACKYSSMDRGFYEDKIRLELPYTKETEEVTDQLRVALQTPFVHSWRSPLRLDDTELMVSPVNCNQVIQAGTGTLSLNVWSEIKIADHPGGTAGITTADVPLEITFSQTGLGSDRRFCCQSYYNPSDREFNLRPIVDADVKIDTAWRIKLAGLTLEQQTSIESLVVTNAFQAKVIYQNAADGNFRVYLVLPYKDSERLDRFLRAASGFTSDLSDNWMRMLYFSLTTITTVGFGDIVPITSEARLWVTFEAIVGLILMGLFLNSLAR